MGKVYMGFRFGRELYAGFKRLTGAAGFTVTGAFERFMESCIESGVLVFPEVGVEGFEAEARVLIDWLRKGKRFYRVEGGVEVNIPGRLLCLLSKVRDSALRREMEEELKRSASKDS